MTRPIATVAIVTLLLSACAAAGPPDSARATHGPHFGGAAVTGTTIRGPG